MINKRSADSSLEKINDAVLTQSLFGRMFGYGDLEILTAAESGISRLRMLRDADDFKRAMLDAKHELELELSGAGRCRRRRCGPRRRIAGRAADGRRPPPPHRPRPRPPPAPAAAAAPRPSQMSADEVTRTLASLADLRDRGAISAEEYEAKKAELLGRL